MKFIRYASLASLIVMASMIVFSISTGNLFEEGAIIGSLVWGQMSLVDLYVGFFLVYLWVFYKESSLITRVIWAILFVVTGSMATALYIYKESLKTDSIEKLLTERH
jgi:hypothetical protein